MFRIKNILFLFCIILFLSGCSRMHEEDKDRSPYLIGVAAKSEMNEYWMSIRSGMEKAAADLDISMIYVAPDNEVNETLQKRLIDDLLDRRIDALAVAPVNSYNCRIYTDKADEKDVPVIAFDTRIKDADTPYVGSDNYKIGEDIAKQLSHDLNGSGYTGIISGTTKQTSHQERIEGFLAYLETYTSIEVQFIENGYSNSQMSESKMAEMIEQYPQLDAVFITSAVTAMGMAEHVHDRPLYVYTVDLQRDSLEALKNGEIAALVSQDGFEIGYQTISHIVMMLNNEKTSEDHIIPADILTAETLDQYTGRIP